MRFLFNTLDDDNSGTLSLEEFHDVCDVLHFSFKRMRTQSWVERHWPHVWDDLCLGALRRWVKQESGLSFTRLETTTMVANSIVVFVEAIVDLNNLPGQNGFGWGLADFGFSVAYVAFTAAKLTVIPLEKYLLSYANRFDLIVTLVLGVVALLWILPRPVLDNATLRYFTLLRLLRLIQLMGDVPSFAFIFDCIASMIVGSAGVLLLVFSSTGLWAVAGVQIFGGKMYRDVEVPEDSVPPPDADLFTSNYDVFVPNDLSVAFMPLFSMLVSGGPITEIISGSAYAIDAGCDTCGLWLSRLCGCRPRTLPLHARAAARRLVPLFAPPSSAASRPCAASRALSPYARDLERCPPQTGSPSTSSRFSPSTTSSPPLCSTRSWRASNCRPLRRPTELPSLSPRAATASTSTSSRCARPTTSPASRSSPTSATELTTSSSKCSPTSSARSSSRNSLRSMPRTATYLLARAASARPFRLPSDVPWRVFDFSSFLII